VRDLALATHVGRRNTRCWALLGLIGSNRMGTLRFLTAIGPASCIQGVTVSLHVGCACERPRPSSPRLTCRRGGVVTRLRHETFGRYHTCRPLIERSSCVYSCTRCASRTPRTLACRARATMTPVTIRSAWCYLQRNRQGMHLQTISAWYTTNMTRLDLFRMFEYLLDYRVSAIPG
jgi:hypothetical protein